MARHTLRTRDDLDDIRGIYEKEDNSRQYNKHSFRVDHEHHSQQAQFRAGSNLESRSTKAQGKVSFPDKVVQNSPTASVRSTIASQEDLVVDPSPIEKVHLAHIPTSIPAIPTTPSDFSALFPSARRLKIQLDHSTDDGNMNLRIDTEVELTNGTSELRTLFHLRMHDLEGRRFSLRRYCRDSGREVCHSIRKSSNSSFSLRPGLQRSLSNALSSMRPKTESRSSSGTILRRQDSGHASMHSSDAFDQLSFAAEASEEPSNMLKNQIRLDFSNYAQVDVKRHGPSTHPRYSFEYWGKLYHWKRISGSYSEQPSCSYRLFSDNDDRSRAYLSHDVQARQHGLSDTSNPDWIPPSSMAITDHRILDSQKDLADVIVSVGLIALVDDAYRYESESTDRQSRWPKVRYIGPRQFIREVLRRSDHSLAQGCPASRGQSCR